MSWPGNAAVFHECLIVSGSTPFLYSATVHVYIYLLKNSLAVKKGAALFKMASVKKVVKSKGAAKKWL